MKPKCIVLDEPTAMLDPSGRREVLETVLRLNKEEGITIVFITHNMDEAVRADRVIVIDSGEIKLDSTPENVFGNIEALRALQLDVPQSTMLIDKLNIKTEITVLNAQQCAEAIYKELK